MTENNQFYLDTQAKGVVQVKIKLLFTVSILVIILTACTSNASVQSSAPNTTAPAETAAPSPDEMIPSLLKPMEYLPEVFPAQYRDNIIPEDTYVKALFTDGSVIVVPDMKFLSLPQEFRDTLKLTDSNLPYSQYLDADVPEFQDVFCSVYETDDLQIITAYYDPQKADFYSDAGVEYIRTVSARSDAFCTYQGIRLGDPAQNCTGEETGEFHTSGTPYMTYVTDGGELVELSASSFSEIAVLVGKEKEIFLFSTED